MTLEVGDKVTVRTNGFDPPHLECSPRTVVVEVRFDAEGPIYWVGHPAVGNFPATRFGPFSAGKLKVGW